MLFTCRSKETAKEALIDMEWGRAETQTKEIQAFPIILVA
jgi:hypothetical protein